MRVREPLAQFVRTQLGPLDMVAVMYPLMSVSASTFTRDHEPRRGVDQAFEGRKYDYRPRNPIEEQYANYPAQTVETIRNQVDDDGARGPVGEARVAARGPQGRHLRQRGLHVAAAAADARSERRRCPGMGNPAARNPMAGDNADRGPRAVLVGRRAADRMRDVFDTANRNNTAIYALDPRGLAAGEFDISENIGVQRRSETLRADAGHAARAGRRDRRPRHRQPQRPRQGPAADHPRHERVLPGRLQLVGDEPTASSTRSTSSVKRPGVQVRSRKGYWAPTAAEAAKAEAPPKPRAAAGGREGAQRRRDAPARRLRLDMARHVAGAATAGRA